MSDNEVEDSFVNCDCCECIINMDKDGYYVLQRDVNEEEVWCHECYYSDSYAIMKDNGWICDDDDFRDDDTV
jgi:hypothetical protein